MQLKLTNILKEYSTGIVNKLKQNFKQQNSALTDQQMDYYINRFDQLKSSPKVEQKDITKYSFQQLEQIVDSFPTKDKVKKQGGGNNVDFSQTELIYNQSPLQIFHGDSERTCIKIKGDFPATWCVSRSSGGNMYKNYRYQGQEPSFYFVKNLDRMNKIQELSDDKYCFFVVQYNNEGGYVVTSALNDGDEEMSWNNVVKLEPLLQGKESLFKHVPLTDNERKYYERFINGIEDEEYKTLSYEEKKIYISITNKLNDEKFKNTPSDLINDFITTGVELSDNQLEFIKDKKQLLDNYRRVIINTVIPEYLKTSYLNMGSRWFVLTDKEAIDLYEKKKSDLSHIIKYKPNLLQYFYKDIVKDDRNIYLILLDNIDLLNWFEEDLDELNSYKLSDIISHHPTYIDKFKNVLNLINVDDIKTILIHRPELIKYFENRLDTFNGNNITNLLSKQPTLIKYFKNSLHLLNNQNIVFLLQKQSDLIDYFENRLDTFDGNNITNLLSKQPTLIKYFIKYFENYDIEDIEDIYHIIYHKPELTQFFYKKLHLLKRYMVQNILYKHGYLSVWFDKYLKENLKYPPLRNILKKIM